jgi:hypothetical protein
MKIIRLMLAALLLPVVSACIVVPAGPGYYGHGYYHDSDRRGYR